MAALPPIANLQAFEAVARCLMAGDEEVVREHRLTPVLNDVEQVRRWNAASGRAGERGVAMIHVDTGMNRLGLTVAEAGKLAERCVGKTGIL